MWYNKKQVWALTGWLRRADLCHCFIRITSELCVDEGKSERGETPCRECLPTIRNEEFPKQGASLLHLRSR